MLYVCSMGGNQYEAAEDFYVEDSRFDVATVKQIAEVADAKIHIICKDYELQDHIAACSLTSLFLKHEWAKYNNGKYEIDKRLLTLPVEFLEMLADDWSADEGVATPSNVLRGMILKK